MSALGISATTLNFLTQDALAEVSDNPKDMVPRLKALRHKNHDEVKKGAKPEREPVFYSIPRDQWVQTEAPYDAAKKLESQLPNDPQIQVMIRKSGPRKKSNSHIEVVHETVEMNGAEIKPESSLNSLKEQTPDTISGSVGKGKNLVEVSGIPVRVKESRATLDDRNEFEGEYHPTPAGCCITNPVPDPDDENVTVGCPAYNSGTSTGGWLTSGHQYAGETDVKTWQPVNKLTGTDVLGYNSVLHDPNEGDTGDFSFVATDGNFDRKYDIAASSNNTYEGWYLYGTLGMDKIKDLKEDGTPVYKQGIHTGRNQGEILSISSDDVYVVIDCDRYEGDSGGPYYWVDEYGESYMIGIHRGNSADSYSESKGTLLPWIEANTDIYV